jgi:glutathione S-transferase
MLKIYGTPISVHTRKVIVVALHKGLEFENVPVVPVIPGNPPANWRELSPTGKIPALTDGDFALEDSAAICAYLDRLHPARTVYPSSPQDYARALALEQYAGTLFRDVVHPLFHETIVNPRIRNVPTNANRIQDVLTRVVPEHFGYLDSRLQGEWLVGDCISIADIAVVSNLVNYRYLGFGSFTERFPRLGAHFERTLRHPAMTEALVRERPFADSMKLDGSWHVQDR